MRIVDVTVRGDGDASPSTMGPLEASIVVEGERGTTGRLFVGITEGPGTPILLFSHDLIIEEGKSGVQLTVDQLPLPKGRFYLWMGMFTAHGKHTFLPWGPVAAFDVTGPSLPITPRGIVRLAPVYADGTWEFGDARPVPDAGSGSSPTAGS